MKRPILLAFVLAILSTTVDASYKKYAKERQQQTQNTAKGTNPTLVPGYATNRPSEASLDSPGALENAGGQVFSTNKIAGDLRNTAETRPYYIIDPKKDPIILNSQNSILSPEKVLNSNLYSRIPLTEYTHKTCKEYKPPIEFNCSKTLNPPTVSVQPAKYTHYWCSMGHHGPDDPSCRAKTYYPNPIMYQAEVVTVSPEVWTSDCESMDTKGRQCRLIKEICPGGVETRNVTGTMAPAGTPITRPVTKNCWRYEYTYDCAYGFSKTCDSLRKSSCEQMGSICTKMRGTECIEWEQRFRCPTSRKATQELVSKGGYAPPPGEGLPNITPNRDMQEAISNLSILKDIQDEMRANNAANINGLQIFKGSSKRCTIGFARFKNCCVNKGWGMKLSLAHCSAEEKDLAQKQKKKLCVKVGTYCAKKFLGKCIQKKTSYCCFPTKLSRIVQEQGRGQLGLGWGEAKEPLCRGFTVDELSRLDFERLDLSEIFAEITKKAQETAQRTSKVVGRNLSNRVNQMGQDVRPSQTKPESNKPLSGEF